VSGSLSTKSSRTDSRFCNEWDGTDYVSPCSRSHEYTRVRRSTNTLETGNRISETTVMELGRIVYERSLIRRESEPITDPRGRPIGWLLDTRLAMLDGDLFKQVGSVLAAKLSDRGVDQVAGYGYGAFPMVGAVLASAGEGCFNGGFVREQRKAHGRKRLVEGPLTTTRSVAIVDDILNSGRSALRTLAWLRSEGFEVEGILTLFNFSWGDGKERIESEGLWVDTLLDLNLREEKAPSRDPSISMA